MGWLDIFHWPIYSDFTRAQTAADVLIKAKIPTCSKNAQAKPTEDGSEGEKSITSDSAISRQFFFIKNIKLVRAIKKS